MSQKPKATTYSKSTRQPAPQNRTTTIVIVVVVIAAVVMIAALFLSQNTRPTDSLSAGANFMATQAADPQVHKTPSGLEYRIVKQGTGPKPAETDTVTVNYVGTLTDGTKFDASSDHGGTATFPLQGVIPGWTEGLQYMPVGSEYIFYIPPALGYGNQTSGPIPANSTLVFDVTLISIQGK
ncbi:MAG TPA: FKBP-type peptidyl-prolyl cis-trans isomerase [Phototrophicaceae bacterium]|nr:FKBP-type peptidyl-prolyl cis-trans isomerase [Phototrophicaceae bacterium]